MNPSEPRDLLRNAISHRASFIDTGTGTGECLVSPSSAQTRSAIVSSMLLRGKRGSPINHDVTPPQLPKALLMSATDGGFAEPAQ